MKTAFKIFLLGFFLAPIGDMVHVATGTTSYPTTYAWYLLGIPWWVFPFFGISGVTLAFSNDFTETRFFKKKKRLGETSAVYAYFGVTLFLICYILSGLLNGNPLLANLVLGLLGIIFWYSLDRTFSGFLIGIYTGLIGTSVEIFLVHNQVFSYLAPNTTLFGVATWLPWLYFTLAIGLGNFLRYQERAQSSEN
jgi:hypothetical protein